MFDALLIGLAAGYAIAIPVGPIALLIIRTAMRGGLRPGLAAGAGTATADFIYATLAMLAGPPIVAAIAPVLRPARLIAGGLLLGLALRSLSPASSPVAPAPVPTARTYFTLLALTIVNPSTVIYFASLAVGLPALAAEPAARAVFVIAAAFASLSWQWLLAGTASLLHGRVPRRFEQATAVASALIIGALALKIVADALA
jgi:threonine/homoserine/homoserine lactone efflux protein